MFFIERQTFSVTVPGIGGERLAVFYIKLREVKNTIFEICYNYN